MPQHYRNAPITEAIIDIQVKLEDAFDHAHLRQVGEREKLAYPTQEEIFEATGQMVMGRDGGSASVRQHAIGWKFSNDDRRQIIQSRINGFTFSRLAPYDRWESFRNEARRLWNTFRETANPREISRLAVRYINRIDIPGDRIDLKNYFCTVPQVGPALPQQLDGFFMQLRVLLPEIAARGLINQTMIPPAGPSVVSVVLDVDVYRVSDVPQCEQSIWAYFEQLHDEKNHIFESSITDSTRSLLQPCQF